jgi:hypothetical protein
MAGAFNPFIRIKGYIVAGVPVKPSGRERYQVPISEPTTLATDYALACLSGFIAWRMFEASGTEPKERATGMIMEIYVSRPDLPSFMAEAASHVPARRFEI